jgi:hypothetical protein
MFKHNDGGLSSTGMSEKNDCTVRAFAIVSGKPYKDVHKVIETFGRKNGKGLAKCNKKVQPISKALGINLKQVCRSGSLKKLIENNPNGKMLVLVRKHAFAVVDGIVEDTWQQSVDRHVKGAWILEN